jgi:hypothetical protein
MTARRPTLEAPVIVSRFFKNRRHDQIVTSLETYEGHNLVNIRTWFTDKAGIDRPTAKGISLVVRRLPDLLKALSAAQAKAIELGLLDDESEAGE